MGFKKAQPSYAWLLTGRVMRRSEYGSTECSILREPFAWRASPVRRSRLRSSSDLRRVGGDGFPRLITAWSTVDVQISPDDPIVGHDLRIGIGLLAVMQ